MGCRASLSLFVMMLCVLDDNDDDDDAAAADDEAARTRKQDIRTSKHLFPSCYMSGARLRQACTNRV